MVESAGHFTIQQVKMLLLWIEIAITFSVIGSFSAASIEQEQKLELKHPAGSPKGPDYCQNNKQFRCMDPKRNTQHLFCNCHKYRCERYEPTNMTKFRLFNLQVHNTFREIVAAGLNADGWSVRIKTGEKLHQGLNMRVLSYNYNLEDSARCSAKKCVTPVLHDHCHASPQYPKGSGSGQNLAALGKQALQCKFNNGASVEQCDVNTMDQYEVVSYVAMRSWFEEAKNVHNLSVIDEYALPPLPEEIVPGMFKQYANFIAMVWADTDQVGCAVAKSPVGWNKQFFYVTCHYHTAGNVLGQPVYKREKYMPCPEGYPRKKSQHVTLCGYEVLPPEPPLDFFISIPMSEYVLGGRRGSGATSPRGSLLVFGSLLMTLFVSTWTD